MAMALATLIIELIAIMEDKKNGCLESSL